MKEVLLGPEENFTKLPAEVVFDKNLYWLIQAEDQATYRLVSSRCPHAGAIVEAEKGNSYARCTAGRSISTQEHA